MWGHPAILVFVAIYFCHFVSCEDAPLDGSHAPIESPLHDQEDIERYSRSSPLRWGKRSTAAQRDILRWGKRENMEDEMNQLLALQHQLLQSRHAREAPLRWGKRMDTNYLIPDESFEVRHLRASPLRWGKRSFLDDKRAPLRWGKRTPSRFGKRDQQAEEEPEEMYELGPYY